VWLKCQVNTHYLQNKTDIRSSVYLWNVDSSAYSLLIKLSFCRIRSRLLSHQDPITTIITYSTYNATNSPASHDEIRPSHIVAKTKATATVKKPTSLRNGPLGTWNGFIMHTEPTTHETMKVAAPRSSPIAKLPEFARIAENVEKTSGLPFPNARKVTPATFSSKPRS